MASIRPSVSICVKLAKYASSKASNCSNAVGTVKRLKVYQTQPNYIFFSFPQCSRYTNYPRYTSQNLPTNRQIHGYSGTRMIQRSVTSAELARAAIKGNRARSLHLHDMCVYLPLWSVGLTPRSTIVVSGFGAIGP